MPKNITYIFCYVYTLLCINFVVINFKIINVVINPYTAMCTWIHDYVKTWPCAHGYTAT